MQFQDRFLQFARASSLEGGLGGEERLLQKSDYDDNFGTDEERLQFTLAMPLEVDDDHDSEEEMLQRALAMSIEMDESKETNEERLQLAVTLSMQDDNDNEEIGLFQ
jgi:hypothetical protein